jgi:hypothetical protein
MKKSLLLVVVLVSLSAVRVSAVDLSYNLKVGSSYAQSMKTTFNMGMNVMGQTINMGTAVTSHLTYTVKALKDTCYEIDVRYDSVGVSMSGASGNQSINSSLTSAQGQLSDVLKSFVNKSFQITLSKKGKVVEVRNYEALFSAIDAAGQSGQDANAQIGTQLKQNFSKEAFLSNMEAYMSFFPAKSVNKGDSWSVSNKMVTSGFPVESTTSYTLKDVTNTQYIIFGYSTMKTDKSNGAAMNIQGMTANINMQGGITYDMVLDRNTGWLKEMTGKIDMDATINMGGDQAQGQSMTMKIKGDIVSSDR